MYHDISIYINIYSIISKHHFPRSSDPKKKKKRPHLRLPRRQGAMRGARNRAVEAPSHRLGRQSPPSTSDKTKIRVTSLGIILGLFWDDFGMILGLYWDYFGILMELFWDYYGIIMG